jgi:hypothetical protein
MQRTYQPAVLIQANLFKSEDKGQDQEKQKSNASPELSTKAMGRRVLKVDSSFGVAALGLSKPGEERLGRLPHLFAGWKIDVLLAGLGAPFGKNLFAENILIIEYHENLGGLVVDVRVVFASEPNEAFHPSKKGFFVFLRSDHLVSSQQYFRR